MANEQDLNNHQYERNIKSPYCDYEDINSWEFVGDSGTYTCGSCDREFFVERDIDVTYSSYALKSTPQTEADK